MKCTRPTKFSNSNVYLPCGQCLPCRVNRKTELTTKMRLEAMHWGINRCAFVTLTYSPENLPSSHIFYDESQHEDKIILQGTVRKDHVQNFLKRFRSNYQYKFGKTEIRYFAVGEYGDKSGRAHYHLLLFNVDPQCADLIVKKSWTLGHTRTDLMNENRIKYACSYTVKKMTNQKDFPDGRIPEFNLMSYNPPLGSYALKPIAERLRKRGLFPSTALNNLEKWLIKDAGYEYKPWHGYFQIGQEFCKLDRTMMLYAARYVDDRVLDLAKTLDQMEGLLPYGFRVSENRKHDDSKYDIIKFNLSGEKDEAIKQEKKLQRKFDKKAQEKGSTI